VIDLNVCLAKCDQNLGDFSDFTALEELTLTFGKVMDPNDAINPERVQSILAPNLSRFTWRITTGHLAPGREPRRFGDTEANWLHALAKTAVERRVPLKEVCVRHACPVSIGEEYNALAWPVVERLRTAVKALGIAVTFEHETLPYELQAALKGECLFESYSEWAPFVSAYFLDAADDDGRDSPDRD
jgi:hypothetical protein